MDVSIWVSSQGLFWARKQATILLISDIYQKPLTMKRLQGQIDGLIFRQNALINKMVIQEVRQTAIEEKQESLVEEYKQYMRRHPFKKLLGK